MIYCSVVTVLALVGLTKKRFGHYAVLKILSLGSPSSLMLCCDNMKDSSTEFKPV